MAGPGRRDSLRRSWIRGAGASDGTFGPVRGQHPLATLDVGTPRLSAEWGRLAPGRYTMKLIGRPAGPMRHKDFLQDVPSYSYNLPCGHHVSYRIPVALDGFGYCYDCQDYFRHDGVEVTEIPPRIKRRRLSDDEVYEWIDRAIKRNQIADLLTQGCTQKYASLLTGVSYMTVRRVAQDLGGWRS